MAKSLKVCTYPETGFGSKNGQKYLIDQFGNRYDFKSEYDECLDERFWTIEIGSLQEHGNTPSEIIDRLRHDGWDIREW